MYREYGFYIAVGFVPAVHRVKVNGYKRRLPIVAVNNIRLKAYMRNNIKHRARKEGETLGVVVMTVKTVTLKIILVIDKVIYNPVKMRLKNSAILTSQHNRNGYTAYKIHFFP